MQHTERRVVFFDLDGTLHQQDMFGSFLRYLLRHRPDDHGDRLVAGVAADPGDDRHQRAPMPTSG